MPGELKDINGGICHLIHFMRMEGLRFLEITGSKRHVRPLKQNEKEAPKLRIAIQLNPEESQDDA